MRCHCFDRVGAYDSGTEEYDKYFNSSTSQMKTEYRQ